MELFSPAGLQIAQCASDDEDDLMDDDEEEVANNKEAMSEDDSSVSDVEGSDPEDEDQGQTQAILLGLRAMSRSETKKKYQAGLKDYKVSVPQFRKYKWSFLKSFKAD